VSARYESQLNSLDNLHVDLRYPTQLKSNHWYRS